MRQLLQTGGVGLVLLGQLLRARSLQRERLAHVALEKDEERLMALKMQGQIKGIDLAIDIIFEIANFEPEQQLSEKTNGSGQQY